MDEARHVSQLVGEIYDAALDRSLWPSVLKSTCGFVQGACSAIVAQDPVSDEGQFYFSWGVDPHYEGLYVQKYVRLNAAALLSIYYGNVGDVLSNGMLMPHDEFLASRFYLEWARPQGYCDSVWAILDKSATAMAAVSVVRHERHGLVDDETRRRMGLLAPHFRRALAIGKVVDLHAFEAASLADALDGIASGVFLVDRHARVVHTNTRGHAMIAEALVVRVVDGKLRATDPSANRALGEVFEAANVGDSAVGVKGIAVPLATQDGEQWIAHVLPLTSGARRLAGTVYSATAAMFVRKAGLDMQAPRETIARLYGLTSAELRVLFAIVEFGGVPEIAPILGISEGTVKTHLKRLFEKTGARRQAELVKLVASFANPFNV
jgi:DNA-binding CsgD family transcriptional regulator